MAATPTGPETGGSDAKLLEQERHKPRQLWSDLRAGFQFMLKSLDVTLALAWCTVTAIPHALRVGIDAQDIAELDAMKETGEGPKAAASLRRLAARVEESRGEGAMGDTERVPREGMDRLVTMTPAGIAKFEDEVLRYTVLRRLDLGPALTMGGADALRWILSRIEDETAENLVHDHWHPQIAGPLQVLLVALRQSLERAGERTAWVSADGKREALRDEQLGLSSSSS